MDGTLFEAARTGNTRLLRRLLDGNPLILADFTLTSPHGNLLHVATKAGQLVVVREIITQKPELAMERSNQDGFLPMDIASALGHVEIVRDLISNVPGISQMKGRDGRTALHYAALYGRIEVIDVLLNACPESIKDLTILDETAVHLAVKNYQIEALRKLMWWLEHLGLRELVNWSDKDGNTMLHLAVSQRQLETVELLLCSSSNILNVLVQLNNLNSKGLTAMDIVHMLPQSPIDDAPRHMREILRGAGALRARETINNTTGIAISAAASASPPPPPLPQVNDHHQRNPKEEMKEDLFKFVSYQPLRDSPSEMRNALLVVAALIATVTFQAALSPPDVFIGSNTIFWVANTLGCTASITIIEYLTAVFPFQRELRLSMYSMMFAYGYAIGIHIKGSVSSLLVFVSFVAPLLSRSVPKWIKRVRDRLQNRPSSSTNG